MGFFGNLFGRAGNDTTVTDFQAATAATAAAAAPTDSSRVEPSGSFRMTVEDVFFITGRGTVVTGKIAAGTVHVGDAVLVGGQPTHVTGIEMFRKVVSSAGVGENVGLLLEGLTRQMVTRGAEVTAAG